MKEIIRMKQENTINNGKKDFYFHTFGIDDRLFTPKQDQKRSERDFKSLMKHIDGVLNEG